MEATKVYIERGVNGNGSEDCQSHVFVDKKYNKLSVTIVRMRFIGMHPVKRNVYFPQKK